MTDFDLELLGELKESTAGGTLNYTNVGETWVDNVKRVSYNRDAKRFDKVDYDGTPLNDGERIEFQLHQLITKKNGETFTKTWYIDRRLSGKRAKDKTNWGEITKPSVEKVFGTEKAFYKAMSNRAICAIEDYVTGAVRKYTDKNTGEEKEADVTAPKFIATFKNEKAAKEWADGFYAKSESNDPALADAVGYTKMLLKTNSKEKVKEVLSDDDDFSQYNADELIALAEG